MPTIDNFIMIGFPLTAEHAGKLKEYGIEFDRILFLEDKSEEEPGKELTQRMNSLNLPEKEAYSYENSKAAYDYEAELAIAKDILAIVREQCVPEEKEGIVKEIDCSGSIEDVFIKIRTEIDPFFTLPDNPEDVKVSEEYEDEEKKRIPRSDFGDYCPVTYVDAQFLVKGSEEKELFVYGKRYLFAGDEELEKFRFDPSKYLIVQEAGVPLPLAPPQPKIMVTGVKSAGITTQIDMICGKYKLDKLELFAEYKKLDAEEKEARRRRRLLDRGFVPPEFEEDENGNPKQIPDPALEDDAEEDFSKEKQEIDQLQALLKADKGLVIDGQWKDNPDDENEITTTEAIYTLLENARRMPEVVVILTCKEDVAMKRALADAEDDLQKEFEEKTEKRAQDKKEARDIAREEKRAEEEANEDYAEMSEAEKAAKIKEVMEQWEADREQQEADEEEGADDVPNLDEMKTAFTDKIKATHEKDTEFLENMKEAL